MAMAKVRALAQGTKMPVLISSGFVEGGDPARFANPAVREEAYLAPLASFREDFRKSVTRPNQAGNSGNVHVTVFSLRPLEAGTAMPVIASTKALKSRHNIKGRLTLSSKSSCDSWFSSCGWPPPQKRGVPPVSSALMIFVLPQVKTVVSLVR